MRLSPDEVRARTRSAISRASSVPVRNLKDEFTLRGDLRISDQGFVQLAQDLRSVIQINMPFNSLLVKEIKTASATVANVTALVEKRSFA